MAVRLKAKDGGLAITLGGVACDAFDFFINYGGNRLSFRRGAIRTTEIQQREDGEDSLGPWTASAVSVQPPPLLNSGLRIVIKHYAKADLAVVWLENDCADAQFDADVAGGLLLDLPAGKGYMSRLFMHEFADVAQGYFFCTSTFGEHFPADLGDIDWGNFALCETGGRYCALLPINGHGVGARLTVQEGRAGFLAAGLDAGSVYNTIPLGIIGTGRDPYALVKDVFRAAKEAMGGAFALREEKQLPEIFRYFGWCSWNAFGHNVSADNVVSMARQMREAEVPVGYFLIDDGWQQTHDKKLTGFDANDKFPGGLAQTVRQLREEGIRHVGVWHTLQGYWSGVDPSAHDFAANPHWFYYGGNKLHCPNPLDEQGRAFMGEWYRRLCAWGIDFVKVDNQGGFRGYFYNMMPQDKAMAMTQANLQNAAHDADLPIINCMAQHPECYYHYCRSAVSRANTDFIPEDGGPTERNRLFARRHMQDALYNSLWFQEIVYPDYDMFQTHHSAARCFAALNALSGGPLYTTDLPEKMDVGLLRKLINDDGTLLRPDQPARPCAECLLIEPMSGAVPLAAFAPVGDGCVAVAMNIGPDDKPLDFSLSIKALQMPSAPRYAVYSHFAGDLRLEKPAGRITGSLAQMEPEVYCVVPVRQKFAALGLIDRLLAPAGISRQERADNEIRIGLTSPGLFGAYSGGKVKAVRCGDREAVEATTEPEPGEYCVKGELLIVNTPSTELTIAL